MTIPVVHKLEVEHGRSPPGSPFAAQQVDWALIRAQRSAEAHWVRDRARDVFAGPDLPTLLPPMWP